MSPQIFSANGDRVWKVCETFWEGPAEQIYVWSNFAGWLLVDTRRQSDSPLSEDQRRERARTWVKKWDYLTNGETESTVTWRGEV